MEVATEPLHRLRQAAIEIAARTPGLATVNVGVTQLANAVIGKTTETMSTAPAVFQAADFAGGFGAGFQAGQRMNLMARPIVRTGMATAGHYSGMLAGAIRPLLRFAKTAMGH